MKVVCLLNSRVSYERIKNEIFEQVEWQLETSFDRLRATLATDYFELAIVDQTIENFDEIIEILELKEIKMLIFRGQYDDVIKDAQRKIKEILAEEEIEERHSLKEIEESSDSGQPYKVMVKEVIKTARVEVPVIQNDANSIISVLNLSERAGSSFVASNLARAFAKKNKQVTLFESPVGTTEYFYTMGFYESNKSFYSYRQHMVEKGRIEKKYLPYIDGVTLGVNDPDSESLEWSEKDTFRLLASNSGISIFDIGWDFKNEAIQELLKVSSVILVVVDPLPIQIVRSDDRLSYLEGLRAQGIDLRFVFNRWDESINKKRFEEGFGLMGHIILPYFEPETIYNMYYRPKFEFLIDDSDIGMELEECFYPFLKDFVQEDELQPQKKKRFLSFRHR